MIELTPRAQRQVRELGQATIDRERPEAVRNLIRVLTEATDRIGHDASAGLPAPRPYPSLARPGQAWIKVRAYWIRYSLTSPPVITGVFHDRADIPGRI